MTTIDGRYTVVSQRPARAKVDGASLVALIFALLTMFIVIGAVAISENPWAIWDELMRLFGYVAFSAFMLIVAVQVRKAWKEATK